MNPFTTIKYQLYLLQLENYELERFWKLLFAKGFWPQKGQRKNLVWTAKAKALLLMAVGLHILISLVVGLSFNWVVGLVVFLVLIFFYFLLYNLSLIILWPLDFLVKKIIIQQAKNKIRSLSPSSGLRPPSPKGRRGLVVIGIAGSYGKTTMKYVLATVLSQQFKVAATPESVNTPVAIARWILKNVDDSTQIAIVEMGEHYKGDIAELCKITPPDIAIVTGVNQAHMERMGNLQTVAATILEIESGLKVGGLLVVNADDEYLFGHRAEFKSKKISYYGVTHPELTGFELDNKKFDTEKLAWQFSVPAAHINIEVPILGEYIVGTAVATLQVVGELGGNPNDVVGGLKYIHPVEHRLQPIKSAGNVLVIDDSYNGNPDGVREAIKVLSRFADRRKVFITPGLVETGSAVADVHRQIGEQLAGVADVVILVRNSVTKYIEEGINLVIASEAKQSHLGEKIASAASGLAMTKPKIIWFNTAQEAHASLKDILKPGDVILFQNDWGDQYV